MTISRDTALLLPYRKYDHHGWLRMWEKAVSEAKDRAAVFGTGSTTFNMAPGSIACTLAEAEKFAHMHEVPAGAAREKCVYCIMMHPDIAYTMDRFTNPWGATGACLSREYPSTLITAEEKSDFLDRLLSELRENLIKITGYCPQVVVDL